MKKVIEVNKWYNSKLQAIGYREDFCNRTMLIWYNDLKQVIAYTDDFKSDPSCIYVELK